jgi:hypothetical protein
MTLLTLLLAPFAALIGVVLGGAITSRIQLQTSLREHDPIAAYVSDSSVPLLAVDYRLAPEYPHPCPIEDTYAGLAWLHANAGELGVEPNRIALMGDSAGGGLAACAALLARDRGLSVAKQILIYPMLDDRNTVTDPVLVQYAGWTYDNNYTGWYALLGEALDTSGVPASASAVRAEDPLRLAADVRRGRRSRHLPRRVDRLRPTRGRRRQLGRIARPPRLSTRLGTPHPERRSLGALPRRSHPRGVQFLTRGRRSATKRPQEPDSAWYGSRVLSRHGR